MQMWTEKLVKMYTRWANRHDYKARVVERVSSHSVGLSTATIELESEYVYGYLSGETGSHLMVSCSADGSTAQEVKTRIIDYFSVYNPLNVPL